MVINRFTIVRNGENKAADKNSATSVAAPQSERFQTEIYKAIEILGRKLERSEAERELLAARLAQIESAATVDEATGRMYLPAVIENRATQQPPSSVMPKSTMAMIYVTVFVAFFSLGVEFFKAPQLPVQVGTVLNKDQLAALDALTVQHMSGMLAEGIQQGEWQQVEQFNDEKSVTPETAPAAVVAEGNPIAEKNEEIATALPMPEPQKEELKTEDKAEPVAKSNTKNYISIDRDDALPKKFSKLEDRAYKGVSEAQHDLAAIYAAGKDVPQDYKRAAYWFARAADGGIANAHYNLGVMFQQGLGVREDVKKAIGWYKSAAELGHPEAMYNLGIAYTDGVGVKQSVKNGASYFKRAANAGISQAAYNLGVLYESDFLGKPDKNQAIYWYTEARKKGNAEAKTALERLKKV